MDTPTSPETTQAPEKQAARRRERPPKSPEARQRGLVARQLKRELSKTKDAAAMAKALEVLKAKENEAGKKAAPESAPPEPPAQAAAPKEELRGAPASATDRERWPSDAAVAEFAPLVRHGVNTLAALLANTRFDINGTVDVKVGEASVSQSKAQILEAGLTPLAAKYLPSSLNTPEAVAVMALLTVFGGPLVELATQRLAAHPGPA
jgi:hypothetical protein